MELSSSSSVDRVAAVRHLCQEARVVLCSLRGGPPHVARGDLAQDLMDLRNHSPTVLQEEEDAAAAAITAAAASSRLMEPSSLQAVSSSTEDSTTNETTTPNEEAPTLTAEPSDRTPKATETAAAAPSPPIDESNNSHLGGPYARPFLQVVMDPRAAGPHTLVALRAIQRLLEQQTFQHFGVPLQECLTAVLSCKFEQTDPGADEAVEMAIADVITALVVRLDNNNNNNDSSSKSTFPSTQLLTDAFNTVFITRNTFVHSPALCYHFEDVLTSMVTAVFGNPHSTRTAKLVFEFLVNQLLHTPLVGGEGLDESTREAQIAHDATRVLCLRLVRTALTVGWAQGNNHRKDKKTAKDPNLLRLVQDDLCLSLLMTGQAIWAYHDAHSNISPGFVSLEVLSEICATMSLLWNTLPLRQHLGAQFETMFTGFYTRALVLLRKRKQPHDSVSFNANLIFDAEVEIILESLVDILCLHDHGRSIADNGDGGSLEALFCAYDCHMRRSDVAMGLMVELCRCCGGTVDPEGDTALTPSTSGVLLDQRADPATPTPTPVSSLEAESLEATRTMMHQQHQQQGWRHVPAHLKELCAQAIMGGMKCLFRDDHASAETMVERSKRKRSILSSGGIPNPMPSENHKLANLKSKKRLMRKAAKIFNKKASRGIAFLVDSGLIPDAVTPHHIASFLRNAIVVGLDKQAVGAYLGEAGKAPVAGKSPPSWERDWFHKEVLHVYCSLFQFERQSLLDGLRMFLAAFRLPGEAQQIDRILQAFADSCGQVCEESVHGLQLFSQDPKRASDAAYLLSFSIIMLNTDQHNANIRQDRKMSCEDFVKNNTDYGRDITEKGKELPREYLKGIYKSIREEEIRTEGEGAEGAMTVERWKDVIRCSQQDDDNESFLHHASQHDVEDLTELVLESTWRPIVSAIGGLWGATFSRYTESQEEPHNPNEHSGMLGVQGARLGMDMALDLMSGVRQLGRVDIFRKIFACVCDFTGLVGDYTVDGVERTWALTNSVEAQSAVVVAFRVVADAGEDLDEEGWKLIWSILFELRDLKLIARGKPEKKTGIFHESETDLLSEGARRDWNMCLVKGDMEFDAAGARGANRGSSGGLLGAFGRAFFGSDEPAPSQIGSSGPDGHMIRDHERTLHQKEDLVIWDEGAPSDDEGEMTDDGPDTLVARSAGAQFESQVIRESMDMSRQINTPVTGLERVEETRRYQLSPRALVRDRFRRSCNIESFVSDSRFVDEQGIRSLLKSLVAMISQAAKSHSFRLEPSPQVPDQNDMERKSSDASSTASSFVAIISHVPLSPASEAFAEVLLCEIALKNKDRLKALWADVLQDHYLSRLTSILVNPWR